MNAPLGISLIISSVVKSNICFVIVLYTLMDMVPSEAPAIESIIADRDLLDRLFARLRELDPDADTIIAMWMDDDNVSDRAIAKALGRPQRTFADQMKKYRTELRRIRGF